MGGKARKAVRPPDFAGLLADVKGRIRSAQTRAVLAANAELVRLYWDVGRLIDERQRREGWGAELIPRLALELKTDQPGQMGFSERNIKRMLVFHREYPSPATIMQAGLHQLPAPMRRSSQLRRSLWHNWRTRSGRCPGRTTLCAFLDGRVTGGYVDGRPSTWVHP